MSKTIQSGCVQTILFNGKLEYYQTCLPIPREVAEALNFEFCQTKGKKVFYMRQFQDWDKMWYHINLMQVTVNDWKIKQFEAKKLAALERCVSYSSKL